MTIKFHVAGSIATLSFDRPDKKNAITRAMYQSLADGLTMAADDKVVRAIVIKGEGGIFTAGNDVEEFLKYPPQPGDSHVVHFMNALRSAEKPVIASVSGMAIGIGTTLLMHCDLVYAADSARFAMPFTQLGLCPEFASSYLFPRMAGYQRAAEKLLLGDAFTADEAAQMGLVSKVMPEDSLPSFVAAQAAKLASLPTESLRITKKMMKKDLAVGVEAAMQEELQHFTRLLQGPDAKEAFSAFLEKRKPDFR
jgi:enoyl-CoA hydratase/carnithine racemase